MQGVALAVVIAFVGILISSLNVIVAVIASCVLLLLNVNLCLILPTLAGKLGVCKTNYLPTPFVCAQINSNSVCILCNHLLCFLYVSLLNKY